MSDMVGSSSTHEPGISDSDSFAILVWAAKTKFEASPGPYLAELERSIPSVFANVAGVVVLSFWGAGTDIEFVEPPTKAPAVRKCKAAQKKCSLGSDCCSGCCQNKKRG
jgi:hypothetical protein